MTARPTRNQPRPGVWSISILLETTSSRSLGLNAHGNCVERGAAQPAGVHVLERTPLVRVRPLVQVQHPAPRRPRLVIAVPDHHHHAQAGHVEVADRSPLDPPRQRAGALAVRRSPAAAAVDPAAGADRIAVACLQIGAAEAPGRVAHICVWAVTVQSSHTWLHQDLPATSPRLIPSPVASAARRLKLRAPVRRSVSRGQGTAAACHRAGPNRDRRSPARARRGHPDRGRARARGDRRAGGRSRAGRRRRDLHEHILGTITPHRLDAPLVHDGKPVGTAHRLRRPATGIHRRRFRDADTAGGRGRRSSGARLGAGPAASMSGTTPSPASATVTAYARRIAYECARRGADDGLLTLVLVDLDGPWATAYGVPWPRCCSAGRGRSTASTGSARTDSR